MGSTVLLKPEMNAVILSDTGWKRDLINVWIVEDDPSLRAGYAEILASHASLNVQKTFRTCNEVLSALKNSLPDLVLMDIVLPDRTGIECTSIIKQKFPKVIVVMVTGFEESDMVFGAFRAGASGYVTKGTTHTELIDSIMEIVNGGAPISSKIAKMVIESFHKNYDTPLTLREEEILRLVATGKTFTQISEQLFIHRETTKTHVRNIYRKLEVNCRADAISKATQQRLI